MTQFITGKIVGLYLGLEAHTLVTTPCEQIVANFRGLEGDKHAGFTRGADSRTPYYKRGTEIRNVRQVSLVSIEDLADVAVAMKLPEVRPEWLGANVAVTGIPRFTLLPPNTRLIFSSGAVLSVSHENMPCVSPGEVIQDNHPERKGLKSLFPKAAIHKRGVVACVEIPGLISCHDEVQVDLAEQIPYLSPESKA